MICTLAHQIKYLHVRKLILLFINNIYFTFCIQKCRGDSYRQNYTKMFLLCLKRKDSEVFKSSSCKKLLPSVHVTGTTCFDEYFFLHVITGTHNFS